jgi:hypothetical protein
VAHANPHMVEPLVHGVSLVVGFPRLMLVTPAALGSGFTHDPAFTIICVCFSQVLPSYPAAQVKLQLPDAPLVHGVPGSSGLPRDLLAMPDPLGSEEAHDPAGFVI